MKNLTDKTKRRPAAKVVGAATKIVLEKPGKAGSASAAVGRKRTTRKATGVAALQWQNFREVFQSAPAARIALIRNGVPADDFKRYVGGLDVPQDRIYGMLKIPRATINRKATRHEALAPEESAKVVGMAKLIGQVESMLAESADADVAATFDAGKWLTTWMERPLPALGGRRPAEFMDTIEGQEMISRILGMMQSGAYA